MKKVCLVHYTSAPGGIEVLMPGLVSRIPERQFEVFVIRPPAAADRSVYDGSGLTITYGSLNNFCAAVRLWLFARKNRQAIFHGFNTGPFFLLAIRLAGISRVVYSIRGTKHYGSTLQKVFRKIFWCLGIAKSFRLIANSEYSRDIFKGFLPKKGLRTEVIYNPIGSDRIRLPVARERNDLMNIIYLGRLAVGKNLFRWIEIARSIHSMNPGTRFFLYGDGPLKEKLARHIECLGAGEYVTLSGYMQDVAKAYHHADLLMFLSEYESFGNVVVESILCGTPVIATAIPSLREIFRNYPVFLVPDDDKMEGAILEKVRNFDELRAATINAYPEFIVRFSEEQHVTRLRMIYDSFENSSKEQ